MNIKEGEKAWVIFSDRRNNNPHVVECKVTAVREKDITVTIPSMTKSNCYWSGNLTYDRLGSVLFTEEEEAEKCLFRHKLEGSRHASIDFPFVLMEKTKHERNR